MKLHLALPPLGPRDRRALRLGALLVLPLAFVGIVVRPWAAMLLDERASLETERALLARERALVAGAGRDRELLVAMRRVLDASSPRLFGGAETVTASAELARYVGSLATESGLQLDQTETVLEEPSASSQNTDSLPRAGGDSSARPLRVAIRAHGDIRAIVDFLQALEDGTRIIRVERIAIGHGGDQEAPEDGALTFSATVSGLARSGLASTGAAGADRPAVVDASTRAQAGGEP